MTRILPVLASGTLAACGPGDAASPPHQEFGPSPWPVTAEGVGPVRFGAHLGELAAFLPPLADTAVLSRGCDYVPITGAPDSLGFMVEDGRLVRVDVVGGTTATAAGARIGDTEERIRSLYPGAVRVRPHKYTEGRYLIVLPEAPGDTLHRLVFETDGRRVTRYRAGLFPPVEYVEGCG